MWGERGGAPLWLGTNILITLRNSTVMSVVTYIDFVSPYEHAEAFHNFLCQVCVAKNDEAGFDVLQFGLIKCSCVT